MVKITSDSSVRPRPSVLTANASVLLSVVFFGASVVATRIVIQHISPLLLAVFRYSQGSLVLLIGLILFAPRFLKVERREVPVLILLGFILFTLFPLTFNLGLRFTSASRGALMLATMPFWSALLSRLLRASSHERLTAWQLGGVLLTIAGMAVVLSERGLAGGNDLTTIVGDSLMLVTAVLGATYGVLAKPVLTRYSAVTVTTHAMLFGALLLSLVVGFDAPIQQLVNLTAVDVSLVLFLGIFGGALGWFLWTYGLVALSPTQVAVYVNLNPIIATALGVILLGEPLTTAFLAGFATVLGGVYLVNRPTAPRSETYCSPTADLVQITNDKEISK